MQTGEVGIQRAMTKSLFVAALNSGPVVNEPRSKLKAGEGRTSHLQSRAGELAASGPAGRRIRKTRDLCRQARSAAAAADETR
jgi:hypothetical protein